MENIMSSKMLTTRRGTVFLGIGAAVLAAIVLLVYLNQYRNSVNGGTQAVSVLVAKSLIQKGTPGAVVGSTGLYTVSSIPKKEVKSGAFVDPKTLTGKAAAADIYPGQQLTATDFTGSVGNALTENLSREQRAVVVPLDTAAEIGGSLSAGDRVDVWVALDAQTSNGVTRPIVREVLQDMHVLAVNGGNVTLRATPVQSGVLIYATQNAKIWLALRPAVGSTQSRPPVVSITDLLTVGG